MKILVDADACPRPVKEVLYRAAKRLNIETIFFANHVLNIPKLSCLKFIQVPKGFDVADNQIVSLANAGDLIITADVPLASAVVAKSATALNTRGLLYTKDNVAQQLAYRDFSAQLRDAGQVISGPPSYSKRDLQNFSNELDKFLSKHK